MPIRTSMGTTPYSLVYRMEAALPIKIVIPLLRVIVESQISKLRWLKAQYEELVMLDEIRIYVLYNVQIYQA